MKTIKGIIILFLLLITSVGSAATGPFGLDWGMTENEVRNQGVDLTFMFDDGLKVFTTESLPVNLSIAEMYALKFSKQFHLQSVMMFSKSFENDVYGTEGKEVYADFRAKLKKKYGAPDDEIERVGLELWDERDEFYQCLAYSGCGAWLSFFGGEPGNSNSGMVVGLELKGEGRGIGYIKITYETDKHYKAVNALEEQESATDAGAL